MASARGSKAGPSHCWSAGAWAFSAVNALGSSNTDCRQDGTALDPSLGRSTYLFNTSIEGIEAADAILIVGASPRYEAAVLNARIRKRWRRGGLPIGLIGEGGDLRYPYEYLGAGTETLSDLVSGKNSFVEKLKAAKNPLIIIGQGALTGADGKAVLANAAKLAADVGAITESTAANRTASGTLTLGDVDRTNTVTTAFTVAVNSKGSSQPSVLTQSNNSSTPRIVSAQSSSYSIDQG